MAGLNTDEMYSPLEAVNHLLGGKYKIHILFHLMEHPKHFAELQRDIPNASNKMLAQQLKEMAADGLISRTVYPQAPVRTEYALTEYGKTLCPLVFAMYQWGENVFLAQGKSWKCSDADVKLWMKQNHIPPEHAEELIQKMNEKKN